jgi:membrane protein DedA with SNARE-associated domain
MAVLAMGRYLYTMAAMMAVLPWAAIFVYHGGAGHGSLFVYHDGDGHGSLFVVLVVLVMGRYL